MISLFNTLLVKPLFNLLIFIYNTVPNADLGVAVVILVLLVRLLLWPIFSKLAHSQIMFQKLQPEVEKIQKKYKTDRATQTEELLSLYRREKFNPLSGLFLIIIQLPIIIGLYRVFLQAGNGINLNLLYPSVANPGTVNPVFLGLVNLTQPFFGLALLAALAQFFQTRQISGKTKTSNSFQANLSRQMIIVGPIVTAVILWRLPSVIGLYWFLTSAISILQQFLIERGLERQKNG
ncbi:MAG: membrane protein insertase YidC [Parcubacteria group bacterium]|nr:membrane protein insertase YidC [Parcubacteria group bacterium]